MKQYYIMDSTKGGNAEITPLFAGEEKCEKGHTFGPFVRECCLIHFCISGEGRLTDKYGSHKVKPGEMFIIRPGEVTVYSADTKNPWHYRWVSFVGRECEKFNTDRSVYKTPLGISERLAEAIEIGELAPEIYKSIIYELIYLLFKKEAAEAKTDDQLHKIRKHIHYNYMYDIKVSSLSQSFGIERSHLYRTFKKRYGISVKEYISSVRLEKAKEFLSGGFNVSETARLVGYNDEFNFSKAFSKKFGTPPSQAKKKVK